MNEAVLELLPHINELKDAALRKRAMAMCCESIIFHHADVVGFDIAKAAGKS